MFRSGWSKLHSRRTKTGVKADKLAQTIQEAVTLRKCHLNSQTVTALWLQGPLAVSEDSECLDQVAQRPHQEWGKADKLAQITWRAVMQKYGINISSAVDCRDLWWCQKIQSVWIRWYSGRIKTGSRQTSWPRSPGGLSRLG